MNTGLCISISGGGALGIGPAWYLKRLEEDLGRPLPQKIIGQAGTSTGSIIAACLAEGFTASKIFDLYEKNLQKIFTRYPWYKKYLPKVPKYDNSNLKDILRKNLSGKCTSWNNTFIPTTFMNSKNVEKVWDSKDDVEKALAVLTSCSAPTYFDVIVDKDKNSFCDGGLWANSCPDILMAGMFNAGERNIRILNLETGMEAPNTTDPGNKTLIQWAGYIMDDWVARSSKSRAYICKSVLGEENLFTVIPKVDKEYKMDNLSVTEEIIAIWEEEYKRTRKDLLRFVNPY